MHGGKVGGAGNGDYGRERSRAGEKMELFQVTPSLKKAAGLINGLEAGRFSKILTRIMPKLHLKDEPAFSPEEIEKLPAALKLEPKDVELVLDTSTFIMQQAAYHLAKPAVLSQHLQKIGLEEEKIQVFVGMWTAHGKSVVEKLQSRTFYPKQLDEVKWRLNLQIAQSSRTKMKLPNALFEFGIKDGEEKDRVRVEFTHEELFKFYEKVLC
jgi:hypothetical protein